MSPYYETSFDAARLPRLLMAYRWRWLLPTLIVGGLSCTYAVLKRDRWEASQAVSVRDETTGGAGSTGDFQLEDEMKATQETVLEIARSRPVLSAALLDVGPPDNWRGKGQWPSQSDVDDLQDALKLTPPKGAEFGKTEIFYVKLRDRQRDRAINLLDRLCVHLADNLGELRGARARGMAEELTEVVSLAVSELEQAQQRLADMERKVGSNLVELRMLEQSPAGVSELNRELSEAENEVRLAQTRQSLNRGILKLLRDAQNDPQLLVTAPNTLFEAQPNLKRLADGLVDVQLKTSSLLGVMTERHPQVRASRQAEETVRQKIFSELTLALHAIEAENQLADGRVEYLEGRLAELRGRMSEVAALRVKYASLNGDVIHRRSVLEAAERQLADVRASQAVALKCSLIDRIGVPDTGARPVGPGRVTLALVGVAGGLMAGFGILVLTIPIAAPVLGQPSTNGKHRHDDAEPAVAGNGHAHVAELLKNRFANVP
jgi:succinoglycan biosynthesis transport protein ExoP